MLGDKEVLVVFKVRLLVSQKAANTLCQLKQAFKKPWSLADWLGEESARKVKALMFRQQSSMVSLALSQL